MSTHSQARSNRPPANHLSTPTSTQPSEPLKVNRGDDKWMRDQEADRCKRCTLQFHSVKRRKHHCRMCGLIVCDQCSKNRVQLKKSGKKSRVCNECFNQIAPRHMRSVSSMTISPSITDTLHSDRASQDTLPPIPNDTNSPDMDDDGVLKASLSERDSNHRHVVHHEHATTEEVEEIIENLRQSAMKQKDETVNAKKRKKLESEELNSSWKRTKSFPERSNTEGTFVEYEVTHKATEDRDEEEERVTVRRDQTRHSKKREEYPYESPQQPLLNSSETRCCSCVLL